MVKRVKQTLHKHLRPAGYTRWFRALVAFVVLASLFIPTLTWLNDLKAYALSPEAEKVISPVNKNLSSKFTFDQAGNRWQFNKNGSALLAADIAKQQKGQDAEDVGNALSQLAAKQVGGGGKQDTSLYSVNLPVNAKQGITYYDNVTRLSFKMIPNFTTREGKLVRDRIIYPFAGGGQIVYTAKANELKEDIVLSKNIGDRLSYSYSLDLPETLEAKLLDDGAVGIYSANPALFGNISFSDSSDKARIMDARKNGTKDNLVFKIPAPFIKDQAGKNGFTRYYLDGNKLTVAAANLDGLKYPLTVDPSVTITSATDFATDSNEESNVDFGITGNDDVKRGAVTGGSIGSWTSQTSIPASGAGSCGGYAQAYGVYNGYIYLVCNSSTAYAKLNTNGTINGSWQTGTAPPNISNRAGFIYNGYMYITGGNNLTNGITNTYYIKLNSNGTMAASWTAGTNLNTGRYDHGAIAYNGYAYVSGGVTGGVAQTASVERAPINGDGSLGSWTTTGTTVLTSARSEHQMELYNGYLYVTGGLNGGGETVEYAKVNTDGTMGAWTSTTTIPTGVNNPYRRGGSGIHNGYWYIVGGCGASCVAASEQKVLYAPIYASGQVGEWRTGTSLATAEVYPQFGVYNGYIFSFGGQDNNVYSTPIDTAGSVGSFAATNDFNTVTRTGLASVAAAGYLYEFGGRDSGAAYTNTVRYARICDGIIATDGCSAGSANAGKVGTWNATNSFVDVRSDLSALTYGNSIYIIGGQKGGGTAGTNCTSGNSSNWFCPDVQRATIDTSTGALTWSGTYTYSSTGRASLATAIVNNYMYVIDGVFSSAATVDEVDYAPINPDGTLGTFTTTLTPTTARINHAAAAWNGRLYVTAGNQTRSTEVATINASTGAITGWAVTGNDVSGGTGGGLISPAMVASNGYLYASGGLGTTGTYINTVQIAKVNSDGSLGNWSTSANTFTSGRAAHGSAIYNGYVYVLGGCNNTALCPQNAFKDVQYTRISNGGAGTTETWSNKGSFTTARDQTATATYNGYVYLTAGCTTGLQIAGCASMTNDSRYASIAADGSLTWVALNSNVPTSRYGHASVAYNGYLYVVGGCSTTSGAGTNQFCTGFLNDVQRIKLNSDGNTVGNSWTASSTLNTARYALSATVYNGYMYVTGGCSASAGGGTTDCTTAQATVEYAPINSDGSLGSWTTTGGSGFTTARFLHASVGYAGKLYVAGGCSVMSGGNCTAMQNDIQYATINSNGTVSSTWNVANNFATPRYGLSLTAQNGMLYLSGGCSANSGGDCTTFQGDVLTAPVAQGGTLGRWWKQISTFTDARYLHSSVIANGYLYLLGGMKTGPAVLADSQGAHLQLQSRTGQYSKLLSVSPTTDIAGVYYNGSLDGGSAAQYKVAPSSGVFGSAVSAIQGTGSEPSPLCGTGTIYYVQLMMTIGDVTNAVFPDDNVSSVTDITVYYRMNATPPPNLRLNGGKWFYNEVAQPLDICKQ